VNAEEKKRVEEMLELILDYQRRCPCKPSDQCDLCRRANDLIESDDSL